MSDRRLTPFSGRVAHVSLLGRVEAQAFTEGSAARLCVPVADLCPEPGALRDRQLLFGARVTVIEHRADWAFVQAEADGYCGWLRLEALSHLHAGLALADLPPASHVVVTPATHVYREAAIRHGEVMRLSLGARLVVLDEEGAFARSAEGFVPRSHLRALAAPESDPAAVAERLLGTPYLWGGNSRDGIDCSGLVQLALALCGRTCPGDSDLQRAAFGAFLPEGTPARRGDLLFWRGHVAMACDGEMLVHANGHSMSVAHEPILAAKARIAASGEGQYFGMKRP